MSDSTFSAIRSLVSNSILGPVQAAGAFEFFKLIMKYLLSTPLVLAGLLLAPAISSAQHYDAHHGGRVLPRHGGHTPLHVLDRLPSYEGHHYGQPDWHYVVPSHPQYVGTYYTADSTHYYTPAPIPSVAAVGSMPTTTVRAQRPVELTFGGFSRYEDLAGRLVSEANAMCLDLNYNFRHNRNFNEIYAEAFGVLQAAKLVHAENHNGNRETIVQRVAEIDRRFHHVRSEVSGWRPEQVKIIGNTDLNTKLESVEAIIHHLAFDVGVKPHEQVVEQAPPPAVTEELAPPPTIKK